MTPGPRPRRRALPWLRALASAAFLLAIVPAVDWSRAAATLSPGRVDWASATCFLALILACHGVLALRWRVVVRARGGGAESLGALFRILMIGRFVGNALPGQMAGDSVRAFAVARRTGNAANSVASVVVERAFGQVAYLLIGLAALAVGPPVDRRVVAATTALLGGAVLAAWLLLRDLPGSAIDRALGGLPRLRDALLAFSREARSMLLDRTLVGKLLGWSLVLQLLNLVAMYFCFRMFAAQVDPLALAVGMPLVNVLLLLPLAIGGIGQREAAFVVVFGMLGVPSEVALAASLALFLALLATSLLGGLFLATERLGPGGRELETR